MHKLSNLGGCSAINKHVNRKPGILKNTEYMLDALFPLVFSENENILYEQTVGFNVVTFFGLLINLISYKTKWFL